MLYYNKKNKLFPVLMGVLIGFVKLPLLY